MAKGSVLDKSPPDGTYAVITHGHHLTHGYGALLPPAFPWMASIYRFENGVGDYLGCNSDIAGAILEYNVAKVYVVGMDASHRNELNQKLAVRQIELAA